MVVINVMARGGQRCRRSYRPCLRLRVSRTQDEVTGKVFVDDASVAKMSGGDVDVEPFLVSRNTLGNDEPQLKFSKTKTCQNCRS